MNREEFEVKVLLYIMIKSLEEISKVDEEMQEILEDFDAKIQWKLGDLRAYLVFGEGKVTGKLDEEIENPDVTLIMHDLTKAKMLLSGELDGTSAYMSGDLTIEGNLQITMQMTEITELIYDYMELIRE